MKLKKYSPFLLVLFLGSVLFSTAQDKSADPLEALSFRSIGPAFTSGRIADIAIHPENENVWYIAVGSGGVWKTVNSGTTWEPIFDDQSTYSIGSIVLDPSNPSTIWVGTGENVGGRHVGYGDGIYVSHDDGKTWTNMGLNKSEHLSTIIVHPENSDIVWVAAQGPLWSKGGERGVYKTVDGGLTWTKTLGDDEWTGATDLLIDPLNPDVLYAATWQRHRTVAAYLGGGPGSGLHKSTDGGETWIELTTGIPKEKLGKIGLALSPFNNEVIYAAIETERLKGGVFISENGGRSWTKQSNTVSGGTGPHYYQELYASPHKEGRLYLMNNYVKISEDHGKTFVTMNEKGKHVDSHAMAFKADDPNYVLFGTDGGLYESFDHTKTWKYVSNLPITQYYKVAVDDSAPFYNIYGGTQDNGSHGGPSRTRSAAGILNSDWWITLGADGHQSAIEPGNPDITYGEFQQGYLWRVDQTTGETVLIQPQPGPGEPAERFNWDAPILVSPHKPTRLYFASQRVWKSENRGDAWEAISSDLTRNEERLALPIMGAQQSWDNAWDVLAMSNYNTITSLAESPIQEGLLYAGTDDGIIQVSEDGGANWTKVELGAMKGMPARPFVNDVRADLFDANVVYAALDNHKSGDFRPFLLKSTDKGRSWRLINGNLPKSLLTWRLVQDHVKKDLLFAATENGVYYTSNGGAQWNPLNSGLPTIPIRDITIQRRENDLVAASFGRGFYILDDMSPLREYESVKGKEAHLFEVKPAYWYVPKAARYAQGSNQYAAKNPPFGAIFTYYLKDSIPSMASQRKMSEKGKSSIPFPGWDALEAEKLQETPAFLLTVKNSSGEVVKVVEGTNKKGFNRVNWALDLSDRSGVDLEAPEQEEDEWDNDYIMATPGAYSVQLWKMVDGKLSALGAEQSFEVVPLAKGALEGATPEEIIAFRKKFELFQQDLKATETVLSRSLQQINAMQRALLKATKPTSQLAQELFEAKATLQALDADLNGNKAKAEIGERQKPSASDGLDTGETALTSSTYGPTENHKAALATAQQYLTSVKSKLAAYQSSTLPSLESKLKAAGAPWIEGQGLLQQ